MHKRPVAVHSLTLVDLLSFLAPMLASLSPLAAMFVASIMSALTGTPPANTLGLAASGRGLSPNPNEPVDVPTSLTRQDIVEAMDYALKDMFKKGTLREYAMLVSIAEGLRVSLLKGENDDE